ncbi:hypothetical protein SNEBB_011282 [Seison nebaliae]|nr:hypothetical protein SNEBB_011282 [Seison nebaliae]
MKKILAVTFLCVLGEVASFGKSSLPKIIGYKDRYRHCWKKHVSSVSESKDFLAECLASDIRVQFLWNSVYRTIFLHEKTVIQYKVNLGLSFFKFISEYSKLQTGMIKTPFSGFSYEELQRFCVGTNEQMRNSSCKIEGRIGYCYLNSFVRYCLPWGNGTIFDKWKPIDRKTMLATGTFMITRTQPIEVFVELRLRHITYDPITYVEHSRFLWKISNSCGNEFCDKEFRENCYTCPGDCGPCKDELNMKFVISYVCIVGALIFFLLIGKYLNHSHKNMWNSDWLLDESDRVVILTELVAIPEHLKLMKLTEQIRRVIGLGRHLRTVPGMTYVYELKQDVPLFELTQGEEYHCPVGEHGSQLVSVHSVYVRKDFALNREIYRDVHSIRLVNHENVNKFVGISITNNNLYVYWDFHPKGSLEEVLFDKTHFLNWNFKILFASDVANGMLELHNRNIIHGRLTLRKCLIDNNWRVRISDFALNSLNKNTNHGNYVMDSLDPIKIISSAPEIWSPFFKMSFAQDVYAFGFILYSILTRQPLWERNNVLPNRGYKPALPTFQEIIQNEGVEDESEKTGKLDPSQFINIIALCWLENVDERPSYQTIVKRLTTIAPSVSLIDSIAQKLESYHTKMLMRRSMTYKSLPIYLPTSKFDQVHDEKAYLFRHVVVAALELEGLHKFNKYGVSLLIDLYYKLFSEIVKEKFVVYTNIRELYSRRNLFVLSSKLVNSNPLIDGTVDSLSKVREASLDNEGTSDRTINRSEESVSSISLKPDSRSLTAFIPSEPVDEMLNFIQNVKKSFRIRIRDAVLEVSGNNIPIKKILSIKASLHCGFLEGGIVYEPYPRFISYGTVMKTLHQLHLKTPKAGLCFSNSILSYLQTITEWSRIRVKEISKSPLELQDTTIGQSLLPHNIAVHYNLPTAPLSTMLKIYSFD